MRRHLNIFIADQQGATAIEYSMIAIMISVVVVGSSRAIGTTISATFFGKLLTQMQWG